MEEESSTRKMGKLERVFLKQQNEENCMRKGLYFE